MGRTYGWNTSGDPHCEVMSMEREGDADDIQAQYRGGCGTDEIGTEEFQLDSIPDSAYVLKDGSETDLPDNPVSVIPENKPLREMSNEAVVDQLSELLQEYADELLKAENLEQLVKVTGESADMLRYDANLIRQYSDPELLRSWLVHGETNLSSYIEGWHEAHGYEQTAEPLGRGVNINAGHNVGAVIAPEIWRVLSRNAVVHKMPSNDQFTLKLLHEVYRRHDNPVANTCRIAYWPGGSDDLERNLFSADYVMAWGDDSTIDAIRGKVSPTTRFTPFHFEFGACLVGAEVQESPDDELLRNIAKDFSWGDQLLCFSPLVMVVEKSEYTEAFLEQLAEALENYEQEYSMGEVPDEERMNITRSKKIARDYGNLVSDWSNETTVVKHDGLERSDIAEFHSFRYVKAHVVEDLGEALQTVGSVRNLQEFILATSKQRHRDLRADILDTWAKRIVRPGGAPPAAPITWDGKHPVNELLKWVTDEGGNR